MSNIGIVIGREFNERVRKKSFIITTLLMPVLMVLLTVAPSLIMLYSKSDVKDIFVIDKSGIIADKLESNSEVNYKLSDSSLEQAREAKEGFGVLYIGDDILTNPSNITLYTNSASSLMLEESIASKVEDIVESSRLAEYNIDNIEEILDSVKASVRVKSVRDDKSEQQQQSQSSIVSMAMGYILGFMLYMFLLIYGAMVMSSVIEEKSSRVLEVLVSSVKPFDLLLGKIISIAMVAITQLLIWGVLIIVISLLLIPAIMPDDIMMAVESLQAGAALSPDMMSAGLDAEAIGAIAIVTDFGYIGQIMGYALLFLVGGYLLYSAMFAAVGSAVDTAEDSQNLQLPITMPIILSMLIMMMVAKDPNSTVVKIFSLIPLTSPTVMMARIPHGIATWEIVLSLVLLFASFVGMVWVAAKIYRVGIFMHGKKPTFKDLYNWIRQS